jgi:hypothetical protein
MRNILEGDIVNLQLFLQLDSVEVHLGSINVGGAPGENILILAVEVELLDDRREFFIGEFDKKVTCLGALIQFSRDH